MDKTCYIDFDRTINQQNYPEIGFVNEGCIIVLNKLKSLGYKVVLNSYRADFKNGGLLDALDFLAINEIEVDAVQDNKIAPNKYDINANILFLDDESEGIPLKLSKTVLDLEVVDFKTILKDIESKIKIQ
jgi:hypothetical protein